MEVDKSIKILYTNYKGITAVRHIIPKELIFTSTSWHPEEQWCLFAFDLEKEQDRFFALRDIKKFDIQDANIEDTIPIES